MFSRDDLDFDFEVDKVKLKVVEHDSYFDILMDGMSFKELYRMEKKKKRRERRDIKKENKSNARKFFEISKFGSKKGFNLILP